MIKIKLTPTSISDYFTPPNVASANYGSATKNAANAAAPPTNGTIGSAPNASSSASSNPSGGVSSGNSPGNSPKKDNTLVWVVLGTVVFVGALYLWHRHNKKQEEEEEKRKRK